MTKTILARLDKQCRLLSRVACCLVVAGAVSVYARSPKSLFRSYSDRIFQIQVIERMSGNKSSIGTGFCVSPQGYLATNFHVISEALTDSSRYRLEFITAEDHRVRLKIIDFDVVHDLALVGCDSSGMPSLALADYTMEKGEKLWSIGNPYDLGMTIVEGTYNGNIKKSLYEKILFSGSINPGMSGGPTIDDRGRVVGINVATAGNQISFCVPARFCATMLARAESREKHPEESFSTMLRDQIYRNQKMYIDSLLSLSWIPDTIGSIILPRVDSPVFKCWGDSDENGDSLYQRTFTRCDSYDEIYLSPGFTTGAISFSCSRFENKAMNLHRFYNVVEESASWMPHSWAPEKYVDKYRCNTDFVRIGNRTVKMVMCVQPFKYFDDIFNVVCTLVTVDAKQEAYTCTINLGGVSHDSGREMVRHYLENISWTN